MSDQKFNRKSRVKARIWLDAGPACGIKAGTLGTVLGRAPVKDSTPDRLYYVVDFGSLGLPSVVAEDELSYESKLDEFVAGIE